MPSPHRPGTSTARLVARARSGDRDAYDRLFALAQSRARLFIRLRLGPKLRKSLDSGDVLQDAYLEAHRDFARFHYRDDQAFTRWLCRIIENRIRGLADHHGAQKRTPPGPLGRISQLVHRVDQARTGPQTSVLRAERHTRLVAAMDVLEHDEREALLLRFFQHRTLDEIAELLGKSATSTRRLLGRASRRLAQRLGQST